MDELYLYGDSVHYSYSEQNHPDMMTSANHGSLPTPAVGYGSGISDADSISREVSRAVKAKIASHPLYPTLLQAYIDCQKVGALPEVAKMFDEIRGESNVCEITSTVVSPSFGDVDPELDHFMETYCDLLRKLKSDLSRPVDEAMVFLDSMRTQLGRLCDGSPHGITIHYYYSLSLLLHPATNSITKQYIFNSNLRPTRKPQKTLLRPHRVVQDQDGLDEMAGVWCCWVDLPPELLREVLMRIEASESCWPPRRSVVACAGVCRSWRQIMKEIVKVPEISGMLTLPISVKQPGPRDSPVYCFIKRNRSTQTYYLYLGLTSALSDDGKFLLAARKYKRPTCTEYIISLCTDDISKGSSTYIGKLRSKFSGTKFTIFDGEPTNACAKMIRSHSSRPVNLKQASPRVPFGNYPVGHISYELNMLGTRGPRKMECIMDAIPATAIEPEGVAPTRTEFSLSAMDFFPSIPFFRSKTSRPQSIISGPLNDKKDGALVLRNKAPRWHEQLQCWCLNFHGRVTVASVKNFQLVASTGNRQGSAEHEKIILQFGKVGKDFFTMDYCYPISAFQAFAICLSSFDTRIACE